MTDNNNGSVCSAKQHQSYSSKDSRLSISALLQDPLPLYVVYNTEAIGGGSSSSSSSVSLAVPSTPSPILLRPSPTTQATSTHISAVAPTVLAKVNANRLQHPTPSISSSQMQTPGVLPAQRTASTNNVLISCMNCKTTTTPLWRRDPTTGFHLCNRCGLYLKTYNTMHPLKRIKRRAIASVAGSPKTHATSQSNNGCSNSSTCNVITGDTGAADATMDDVEQIPRPANCNPPELQYLPRTQRRPKQRRITPKQQISLGMTPKCFNCNADQTPLWRRDPQDNIICNACGLFYKLHGKARPVEMKRTAIRRRQRTTVVPSAHLQSSDNRHPPLQPVSVPAADGGSVAGPIVNVADTHDGRHHMGGLDFLMQAAELQLSPQPRKISNPPPGSDEAYNGPKRPCDLRLESLASIATAEMVTISGAGQ